MQQTRNSQNERDELKSFDQFGQDETNDNDTFKWNADDLEFFDLMYDDKFIDANDEFIEYIEKNIYFRNVHLFIERVKNLTVVKNVDKIWNNL